MCILFVYIYVIKVFSHYDFRVLSMSVMGLKKPELDRLGVGGVSSIMVVFNFAIHVIIKPLN